MTAQATLDAVRELYERAMLRPAPTHLQFDGPTSKAQRAKRVIIPWEERFSLRIGGSQGSAGNHRPHKPKPVPERVTRTAMEMDFMRSAVDKAAAATERRVVVVPRGGGQLI